MTRPSALDGRDTTVPSLVERGPDLAPFLVMDGRLRNSHRWPRHGLVPPNAGRSSAEAGLALVEVVIAVGLLVTLAAGVMQLFVMSASALVRARHRTSALILAVEKFEQIRAVALAEGVADLVGRAGPQTEYLDAEGGTVDARLGGVPPGGRYERVWLVDRPVGANGVVRVQVQVAPTRPLGSTVLGVAPAPDGARLTTLLWTP